MATGISIVGRQVLDILPGTGVIAYVAINPPGGLRPKYWGYVALEVISPGGIRYQIAGRSLWYEGVAVFVPAPQSLPSEVVAYWRESGVPWETAV